jgi:hypothetical protein
MNVVERLPAWLAMGRPGGAAVLARLWLGPVENGDEQQTAAQSIASPEDSKPVPQVPTRQRPRGASDRLTG